MTLIQPPLSSLHSSPNPSCSPCAATVPVLVHAAACLANLVSFSSIHHTASVYTSFLIFELTVGMFYPAYGRSVRPRPLSLPPLTHLPDSPHLPLIVTHASFTSYPKAILHSFLLPLTFTASSRSTSPRRCGRA